MIVFTNLPERGDAVLGNLETREVLFVKKNKLEATDSIDTSVYEKIGVVVRRSGKKVLIAYYQNASKKWAERYSFKLTGYTLDNTERTGSIQLWTQGSVAKDTTYVLTYQASTLSELVTQLNTAFQNQASYPYFKSQDWYAYLNDNDEVCLTFNFTDYRQASNAGTSGFALTANFLPDVTALANIRRKHGGTGGEGALSSWYRAITYFRSDLSSPTYNPNSNVTSIKTGYPVCLPAYLGKSTYRKDGDTQLDYCSLLRTTYGEGEQGWLKYMGSCMPVNPTDFGNMGMTDGLARTQVLAAKRFSSNTQADKVLCPAADYAYNISTLCIPQGKWFLGTVRDVADLLLDVKYPSHGTVNDDPINKTLNWMGGSKVNNSSNFWSSCRYYAGNAWYAHGYVGFFLSDGMSFSFVVVPFSLHELA